jgi:hypothetical protein
MHRALGAAGRTLPVSPPDSLRFPVSGVRMSAAQFGRVRHSAGNGREWEPLTKNEVRGKAWRCGG